MSSPAQGRSAQSPLLTFHLPLQQYQQSVMQARKPRYPFHDDSKADVDPSKKQAIVVRGYNADAVAAIKAATGGKEDLFKASYIVGRDMWTIIEQVEDLLLIPSKHWRLTPREAVKIPEDDLFTHNKASKKPIELILVPED